MEKIELSLKDRKILSLIEVDARLTYAEIAKKVGLSKQVVKYRMDLMEKQRVIQEYYAIVNDSRLGLQTHFVYLQLNSLSEEEEKKLINSLKKEKRILSYFSAVGKWDFVIALSSGNIEEFNSVLQKVVSSVGKNVRKKVITTLSEFSYISTKIFSDIGNKTTTTKLEKEEKADELDLKIIKELMSNGRMTLVELAGKFDKSANAIKERIKSLEKKRIIVGYKTKINYELLGFLHTHFFIWMKNMESSVYEKIKKFLIQDGKVEAISRCFGHADIDFRCNVKNVNELYELKRKIKNKFKNEIDSIESLIVVRSGISHLG